MYENPIYGSKAIANDTDGMYHDEPCFCPANAYGDCPYCDQCNICHCADPISNCDDYAWSYGEDTVEEYEDWRDEE